MKRLITLMAVLGVLIIGDGPTLNQTASAQNGVTGSATGHGQIAQKGGGKMTFSFSASVQADGLQTGQGEIYYLVKGKAGDEEVRFHIDIDCVEFGTGKVVTAQAVLSGIVTQSSDLAAVPTNSRVVVVVEDNGEGMNDPADEMTFFMIDDPSNCISCRSKFTKPLLQPIDRGNIQVRADALVK